MPLASRDPDRRAWIGAAVAAAAAFWIVDPSAVGPVDAAQISPSDAASSGSLEVLDVRPNFFMIAGAGGNIGVQVGEDGVVVVDAGSAASAAAVVAAIKRITPKPIRYVIDTGPDADHVGGNEVLSKAGETFFPDTRIGGQRQEFTGPVAAILATEGVLRHMTAASGSASGVPGRRVADRDVSLRAEGPCILNGEAIEVLHQPAAHTDSDAFVFFRRSDVVRGRRRARHAAVSRHRRRARRQHPGRDRGAEPPVASSRCASVPIVSREAGTVVVPGHGRLYDQFDVIEYRDMMTIIRDRVRDLVDGRTVARAGQGRAPGQGLRGALRQRRAATGRRTGSSRPCTAASRRRSREALDRAAAVLGRRWRHRGTAVSSTRSGRAAMPRRRRATSRRST